MNILFLIALVLLIVAILSFLMPWISKKVEEPFAVCVNPTASIPTIVPATDPVSWADRVELGKQRYNLFGFLQSQTDDRAFDALSPSMGSINTDTIAGAPAESNTLLKKLNSNIRTALETVHILPRIANGTVAPIVDLSSAPAPFGITAILKNSRAFLNDTNAATTQKVVGYVEERMPPRNTISMDVAKCEVNNMYYMLDPAPTSNDLKSLATLRPLTYTRANFCNDLNDERSIITKLFSSDANKICGVCIKDAQPYSAASVYNPGSKTYNGIGGMFLSLFDKNRQDAEKPTGATRTSYRPSYGSCAEGYFFLPNERDACLKATNRLNCQEIQERGGFTTTTTSKDGTDVSGSDCVACVQNKNVQFVYSQPTTTNNLRVRVVVPTGTGRTILQVTKLANNASNTEVLGTYTIVSKQNSITDTPVTTDRTINGNAIYFTVNANPDDTLEFKAAQEFPHRPRGIREVFYVGFTTYPHTFENAQTLSSSLDCTLATLDQLKMAQQEGMNVCEVGWAADGKAYTVRSSTVGTNNFADTSTSTPPICTLKPTAGGVTELSGASGASGVVDISGVWCYGIKPDANHLEAAFNGDTMTGFRKPSVANWYTNYARTTTIAPSEQNNIYSSVGGEEPRPNYRGICIQLEKNDTTSVNRYQPINVGVESFITSANDNEITSSEDSRLTHYSRNGRFSDSERIATPKPPRTNIDGNVFSLINQSQYWLWSPFRRENGMTSQFTTFKIKVKVPGYFKLPTYIEDEPKCMNSILYTSQEHINRVITPVCNAGLNVNDTTGCMAYLFKSVGGDIERGTLSPNYAAEARIAAENRKKLLYKDYGATNPRDTRTVEEIQTFLMNLKTLAAGTHAQLAGLVESAKIEKMNEASMQLLGKNAVGPCERVIEDIDGTLQIVGRSGDSLNAKCLDYLYRHTIPSVNQNVAALAPSTYPTMGSHFSGLDYPGGEYTTATEDEKAAFPYKACQSSGTWAPLKNGAENTTAVNEIKAEMMNIRTNLSDIQKAMQVFSDLHKKANNELAVDANAQELALERCYGISKREFITNCNGIAGTALYVYTLSGDMFTGAIEVKDNANAISDISMPVVNTYNGYLTTTYKDISPITQSQWNAFFLRDVRMGGFHLGDFYADYIIKKRSADNTKTFLCVCLHDTRYGKMVSVTFQFAEGKLKAKVDLSGARYVEMTNDLSNANSYINAYENANIMNVATGPSVKDYGIASFTYGFLAAKYEKYDFPDGSQTQNILDEVNLCHVNILNVYQHNPANQLRGLNLDCSGGWCCKPVQSIKNVKTVTITKDPMFKDPYIVLLKDASGVVVQKVARFDRPTTTVEFLEEDVRPYIPYTDIGLNQFNIPKGTIGTTMLQFESAFGRNYFLMQDGTVKNVTENSSATDKNAIKFKLYEKKASEVKITSSPIYSIGLLNENNTLLLKMPDTNVTEKKAPVAFSTYNKAVANADWVFKPAVNGAYAFISIEHANVPGYYLITEPQSDGTYKAIAKVINMNSDIDKFSASWRLYPAV